ncbi:MAG: tetratricopeptide repeat protein [Chthoniobacterales bacterium]
MEERHSVLKPSIDPSLDMSDSDLFWQEHWKKFVWGLAALVVLIIAVGVWKFWSASTLSSAEALYSTASNAEAWREVVQQYPGTVPAGNAQMRLAESLRTSGDLGGAAGELEGLLKSQPEHPLAGAVWLTLGELRQIQGNNEGALEAYRTASSRYSSSFAAPLALLAEAKLLQEQGAQGEARAVLESAAALYPDTPAAMVSGAEASRLGAPQRDGARP